MPRMMTIGQTVLRNYIVQDLMGDGGEASLALAKHRVTGQRVVVKQLRASVSDSNYAERRKVFRLVAQLRIGHPNVLDALECSEEHGELYSVMPFVEGADLDIHLQRRGGRLPPAEAEWTILEIGCGLAACHLKGIVHRDIKPQNIMIPQQGQVLIIDLGICLMTHNPLPSWVGGILGTPAFMAPEQAVAPDGVSCAADWYSLGVILYLILTGVLPIEVNDESRVAQILAQVHPIPPIQRDPSIPRHLSDACMGLLEKRPENRVKTIEELRDALNGTASGLTPLNTCTFCRATSHGSGYFCSDCGAPLQLTACEAIRCLACGKDTSGLSQCPHCGRSFGRTPHKLTFIAGALASMVFRIPEGVYLVGRDALLPRDHHVSRRHFTVTCLNGSVCVQDAGSTNKTYVNDQQAIRILELSPGCRLQIGPNVATYSRD